MSELDRVTDQLLTELYERLDPIMWKLARDTKINGYDTEDLVQEMRIKVWQVIDRNKYDPERCKETSFFYRVCKNHLISLYRKSQFNLRKYDMLNMAVPYYEETDEVEEFEV